MPSDCLHWREVKCSLQVLSQFFGTEQECANFIRAVENDTGLTDLSAISNLYTYGIDSQQQRSWTQTEEKYIPLLNAIFKYSVSKPSLITRRAVMVFVGEHIHLIKSKLMYARVMRERRKNEINRSGIKVKKMSEEVKKIVAPIDSFFSQIQYGKSNTTQHNSHTNKNTGLDCRIALPSYPLARNETESSFDPFVNS